MKVILLGSTGFIGKEVLHQCLKNPAISTLIALSRRNISRAIASPKLQVIIVEDFNFYPDSVLEQLKGADACIWSMGTYNWDPIVELGYPEAFQHALLKVLDAKKPFRYVYLGGALTEPNQEKSLWFYATGRHVRGLAETKFLEFGQQNMTVETYVVKPAAVLARDQNPMLVCLLWTWSVWVYDLAAVMIDLVENGGSEQVVLNRAIVAKGRTLSGK